MVDSNCLPPEERICTQVYPDAWTGSLPIPLSCEEFRDLTPETVNSSSLNLEQRYTDFNAHFGLTEPCLNLLDDASQANMHLSLSSTLDSYYQALQSSLYNSGEGYVGALNNQNDTSDEFLFSSACIGHEFSLSPSSSRPCTAGYEVNEVAFSSAPVEAPLSFPYACGSSSDHRFSFFPQLDQTVVHPGNLLPSTTESIRDPFSLLCLPPYTEQPSNEIPALQDRLDVVEKPQIPIRRGLAGAKQTKPKTSSVAAPRNDDKTCYPLSSQRLDVVVDSAGLRKLLDNVREKKIDGKFVCDRISSATGEICGKKFQRSEHLKRHWATHTNLKPYQCPICHNYFGRTDNLNQHRKTHENAHGRNSKLLHARRLETADQIRSNKNTEHRTFNHHTRTSKRSTARKGAREVLS